MAYATADDLPPELWQAIADDLVQVYRDTSASAIARPSVLGEWPQSALGTPGTLPSRYMGINRHLFNFYLDTKYGEVKWTKLDEKMLAQLDRLQSPTIGSHVRKLQVRAWFVDHLMRRDDQAAQSTGFIATTLETLQSKLLMSVFTRGTSANGRHQSSIARGAKEKLVSTVSSKFVLQLMVSAMDNMRNVVSYSFELRDLALTRDTERFLAIAGASLACSLRKLTLHTSIFKFKSVATLADFDHLEELELHLDYHGHSGAGAKPGDILASKEREARELQEVIVPFINNRRESLQSFALICYASVNLSHFFRTLGPFSHLHRLSVVACLDETGLSDVNAFIHFLQAHRSSLLHVDIRPRVPDLDTAFISADNSKEHRDKAWERVQAALFHNKDILTSVEGLHLPVGNLVFCLQLIQCTLASITHLSLTNTPLEEGDVKKVLVLFVNKPFQLKSIMLELQELTVAIVKLLASRLPGLNSLVLLYDKITFPDMLNRMIQNPTNNWDPMVLFLEDLEALGNGQLDWNVEHITIVPRKNATLSEEDASLLGLPASSNPTETRVMQGFSKSIPTVKSFRGIRWHREAFVH